MLISTIATMEYPLCCDHGRSLPHQQHQQLLYGLETVCITNAIMRKLDAFCMKGLVKILGTPTTFVNRSDSNALVLQKANQTINHNNSGPGRYIKLFGQFLQEKRDSLAQHVTRSDDCDLMRQISYIPSSAIRHNWKEARRRAQAEVDKLFKYIFESKLIEANYKNEKLQNKIVHEDALAICRLQQACCDTQCLCQL